MSKSLFWRLCAIQYFLLILLFEILPKSLVNVGFVLEIGLFAVITLYYIKPIRNHAVASAEGKLTYRAFLYFFLTAAFYLVISFRDLTDYWHLVTLPFSRQYIPRHFVIIVQYFIAFGLGYSIFRSDLIFRLSKKVIWGIMIFSILIVSFSFSSHSRAYSSMVLLMGSLLCVQNRKYIFVLLLLFPLFMHSSSYSIGLVLLILVTYYRAGLARFFARHGQMKLLTLGFMVLLGILVLSTAFSDKVTEDVNNQWRLVVWINEMVSLVRTKFTGVGFGSAYVSLDILKQTNNLNMYTNNDTNDFFVGIFIVGNHSSIVNMFYRMGLAGGIFFILLNVRLLSWCIKANARLSRRSQEYLWWAMANYIFNFVILAFNPGLEMVQFSIGYQLSLAILLAFLFYAAEGVEAEQIMAKVGMRHKRKIHYGY